MTVSEERLQHLRTASLQHGLRSALARTGDERGLTEPQRSRLVAIREELETPDGAVTALRERASRMVLLCEWGEEYLRDLAEREGGARAFEAKMLERFVSVAESARRHLDLLIRLQGRGGDGLAAERAHIARIVEGDRNEPAE